MSSFAFVLHFAGPPPRLDLLLERDPATRNCSLSPLPPPPPSALDAPEASFGMGHLNPPSDKLPHPAGATVPSLTRPEHQFEPQAWRPDLDLQLHGLESLGGSYNSAGPSGPTQVCYTVTSELSNVCTLRMWQRDSNITALLTADGDHEEDVLFAVTISLLLSIFSCVSHPCRRLMHSMLQIRLAM